MEPAFYYRYLEGKFNDIGIYKIACSFIDDYCSCREIKDVRCRQLGRIIVKYYNKTSLGQLSPEYIINLFSKTKFEEGESVIAAKFFMFLIENRNIENSTLLRALLFKDSLIGRDLHKFFLRIFYCENFEEFNKKGLFRSGTGINVFLMLFSEEKFLDDKIYRALAIELENMKLVHNYNDIYSIKQNCTEFMSITREFFINIKHENITLSHINHCIEVANGIKNYQIVQMVCKILWVLECNGLITDEEVKCLISFKSFFLSGWCTLNRFKELLCCKNINRIIYNNSDYRIKNIIQYVNIECYEIFMQWVEFYYHYDRGSSTGFRRICEHFDDSLSGFVIDSIDDINFETFYAQILYFSKYGDKAYTAPIVAFYLFLYQNFNQNIFEVSNVDIKILQRPKIVEELLSGAKVINYNPTDEFPREDKWLLCYGNVKSGNGAVSTTKSKIVDFTSIKSAEYCSWIKDYIWKGTGGIYQRINGVYSLIEFVNYIYDLKHGIQLSIFCKRDTDSAINSAEALAYKTYIINKELNESSKFRYVNYAKRLLEHVSVNNITQFESGVTFNLKHRFSNNSNPNALSNEEVSQIVTYIKDKSRSSVKDEIYYAIVCLLIENEFRVSQILALTEDCIQEANKKNQYIIVSETKTSNGEEKEQPITIQTKKLIEHINKITFSYRVDCVDTSLKKQIFLLPGRKKGTYKIISPDEVTDYIKSCCDELGLERYNVSNLRDTHMTRVNEHVIRNNLSEASKKVLNGHLDVKSDKFYEDIDIRTLLEAVHGIIIGDVNIRGQIVEEAPTEIERDENVVCNKCGYCGAKSCHDTSYLECLMCKDFIATLSRIPFFEQQIDLINMKISSKTIKHDKEDLMNIKRLLVEFLNRLLELKLVSENRKE